MKTEIKTITVIGSGVMGSRIAAHAVNAGIETYLLDIAPNELNEIEKSKGFSIDSSVVRNRIVNAGLETAIKSKPASFFSKSLIKNIHIGNFEENKDFISKADWIIEAVTENLAIKEKVFGMIEKFRKPGSIISSNTSGIPISLISKNLSPDFKRSFCGTHFFNPPRYMKLLEIIPIAETSSDVIETISDFSSVNLGKGIVYCKDTPNFIANRVGILAILNAINIMIEDDYTIEEVDLITGPATGKPKSATFRTGDLVGIDTLFHVANNLYDAVPNDERREVFKIPRFINEMVKLNWLGDKTKFGFYKKTKTAEGKKDILTLDWKTLEHRAKKKAEFASISAGKNIESLKEKLKMLAFNKDRAGVYFWKNISDVLLYSANRIPEISDDIVQIDNAMKWGFNWELGPFETWDAIGVKESVQKMESEGKSIPLPVENLLKSGKNSFYEMLNGNRLYFDFPSSSFKEEKLPSNLILLPSLKERKKEILSNSGASLIDIGEGVACLEFHSKMNAIGEDIIQLTKQSIAEVEKNFTGMILANHGVNFSVGANLMMVLMSAQDEEWDDLDLMVKMFQQVTCNLRCSSKPIVAAPFGLTLGGGCEFSLGADKIHASVETYMGLVELGVGVIPAGGGTKEMLIRSMEGIENINNVELFPFVQRAFEIIGMAKVSTSAVEAKEIGYMRQSDSYSMNKDFLISDAKNVVLGMSKSGYVKPKMRENIPVLGAAGLANLKVGLHLMKESGYISEYDAHIAKKLSYILCGGDLSGNNFVTEQYLLDLEREAFLSLLGEKKTQDRIKFMLEKGKPLRN